MSEQDTRKARRERAAGQNAAGTRTVEPELTDEEKYEAELAEKARQNGGGWDSVAPGKADNFGKSFSRMIAPLRPSAVWFILVSIAGAVGVVLTLASPKLLGEATNLIYKGFISVQLAQANGDFPGFPDGTSQDDVVAALRQGGQDDFANQVAALGSFRVGDGVDFEALRWVIIAVLAIYIAAAFLSWIQGYVINV